MQRSIWRVALVLGLMFAATLRHAFVIPAFEGPDERNHFGYVTDLRQTAQLPDQAAYTDTLADHEAAQPPLYYVVAWGWSFWGPFDVGWEGGLKSNNWAQPSTTVLGDNQNERLFGPDQIPYNRTLEYSLHWARLVSVFMGVLAVALSWRAICVLVPREGRFPALLLFAMNPVLLRVFGVFGNDAAAALFGVVGVWVLVRLSSVRELRHLVFLGALVGLGTLTKASLLVFPVLGAGVLLLRAPRRMGYFVGPSLLVAAPWYLWGALRYGDPFGMAPHIAQPWAFDPPRTLLQVVREELWTLPTLWQPLWLGTPIDSLPPGVWLFAVQAAIFFLALIGWIVAVVQRKVSRNWLAVSVLVLVCAAFFVAYLRWLTLFTQITARLLMPGYLALVILIALGVSHLRVRGLLLAGAGPLTILTMVFVGFVSLPGAYRAHTVSPQAVPPLQGGPRQFGDVMLLGYHIEEPSLTPDQPLNLRLCWQSLKQDGPLEVPTPFGISLVNDGTRIADRVSLHGMGSYTLWQPGRAFCDRFQLSPTEPPSPSTGYEVLVGLFDPSTGVPLPEDADRSARVGWIGSPGPMLPEAEAARSPYMFAGGLHLLDFSVTEEVNELVVQTEWGTGEWTAQPLRLFVHVFDAEMKLVAQQDTPLGEMHYPAFLWGHHERTYTQTARLLLEDAPGEHCVRIGLYEPETQMRVEIVDENRARVPDGIVQLKCIIR